MTETLSEQHALAFVENCPLPLLVTDRQGRVISYNQAFERLVGRAQASDLQGHTFADLGNHPARMLLSTETSVCWTDRNADRHYFEVQRIELSGTDFVQARLFVDITRQVELEQAHNTLNEELKQHILTDPVTGLLNQRGVMLALEPQVARSRRYSSPMAVIMMDIHCQSNSDNIRLHVARLLKDQLRWADLIGCTQQQEFVLILPETTPEAGVLLADKLSQRLREMAERELDGQPIDTCYGVTGWRRSDNANALLSRAGMALSKARSEQRPHSLAL
jgi:diguanylate cyclase (GGDEF)-like protein/PAS domain S-box-containing protein